MNLFVLIETITFLKYFFAITVSVQSYLSTAARTYGQRHGQFFHLGKDGRH